MAHEELTREQRIEGSSDRSFGAVFTVVFFLIAVWPLINDAPPRWWAGGIAAIFGVVALVKPTLLAGLNRVWVRFGVLLGKVVSPIALGILFYGVLFPIGVVMRLTRKDPLRLKHDATVPSYWVPREPPGPPPDSMNNQF